MGSVLSKAADGFGNALATPFKAMLEGSCEDVCSGVWDVSCFITHLCVSDLIKLFMILVLCYISNSQPIYQPYILCSFTFILVYKYTLPHFFKVASLLLLLTTFYLVMYLNILCQHSSNLLFINQLFTF
ncbi:unnamed protein product, partial [Cuscuta europaea]